MRRIIVTLGLLVALAVPAAVSADTIDSRPEPPAAGSSGGMSIEIENVVLTAKVVVTVDLTVTCQPKPPSEYPILSGWEQAGLSLWVKQASGRSIAAGYADVPLAPETMCDGSPHTVRASVSADADGVPFKSGSAVVAAAGFASYFVENWETGQFGFVSAHASTGWLPVRLGK
jgi:hypothetical protein